MDADDEGYPEIPLSPEFEARLIRTVERALAERRWRNFLNDLIAENGRTSAPDGPEPPR